MRAQDKTPAAVMDDGYETANDRFKKHFGEWLWGSMIAAVLLHFAAFAFWPDMQADDFTVSSSELTAIEIPPEVQIPPPPQAIARPATPVIAAADVSEDITIAPTTFDANPVSDLPPPPDRSGEEHDIGETPTFTPYTVAPELQNRAQSARVLEREYPPLLRDAGIGGIVQVYFFIDEEGVVQDTRLNVSSGHAKLDTAALAVAEVMKFSPAWNRDKKVPVWVSLPITFQVRNNR